MSEPTAVVPLRIRFPYESEEDFIDRYGTNVARGGVFVATRSLKSEGTVLQFEFVLRGGDRLMRGEGVVVKTHVDHGGSRSGMTVRFTRLDPPSKALVERVVARRGRREVAPTPVPRELGDPAEQIPRTSSLPEIPAVTVDGSPLAAEEPVPDADRRGQTSFGDEDAKASLPGGTRQFSASAESASSASAEGHSHVAIYTGTPAEGTTEDDDNPLADAWARATAASESAERAGVSEDLLRPEAAAGADATVDGGEATHPAQDRAAPGDADAAIHADAAAVAVADAVGTSVADALASTGAASFAEDSTPHASTAEPDDATHARAAASLQADFVGVPALANAEPVLGIDLSGSTLTGAVIAEGGIHKLLTPVPLSTDAHAVVAGLRTLCDIARQRVGRGLQHTALCIPSRYSDLDRSRVLAAATSAELPGCRLFNASTAVALAFAHGRGLPRKRVLVCDAGTTEAEVALVAITGDDVEVVATAGMTMPAGLTSPESTPPDPILSLASSLLEEAHLAARSIDEVLLVGPGADDPSLRERLASALERRPVDDVDALGAVVSGAALLALGLYRNARGRTAPRVNETLGAPLGIVTRDGAIQRVLERGTPLPAQKSLGLPVAEGDTLALLVVQGNGATLADNDLLGTVELSADRAGEAMLHLDVGADGRVDLTAQPPGSRSPVPVLRGTTTGPEALERLLSLTPQPAEREPDPRPGRLWGSIRRLLGGR